MPEPAPRILRAWLDSRSSGIVEFERDWNEAKPPLLRLGPAGAPAIGNVARAPDAAAGRAYGYFLSASGKFSFVFPLEHGCKINPEIDQVYVAGDFNGWQAAIGQAAWLLTPAELDGERVLLWSGAPDKFLGSPPPHFKFVTGEHSWILPEDDAPNSVRQEGGIVNRVIDPAKTGRHLWRFTVPKTLDLGEPWTVVADAVAGDPVALGLGSFFYELRTTLPLGALVEPEAATFRLFAPRARSVTLHLCDDLAKQAEAHAYPLERCAGPEGEGAWQVKLDQSLHGWFYWYTLDGIREGPGRFDPSMRVLDPYARATVSREGPGIVLSPEWVGQGDQNFVPPAWQDLIIAESHVRDLAANAPVAASAEERRGFTGLLKWVESPEFYLHSLGVNAVELQPVQESDARTPEEYHWGYMTTDFFAPASTYALSPATASGVRELQDLVAAFHRRGIAVLLDVVYNHVGEPAHLLAVDGLYYFSHDRGGKLTNWSGCGNDLRADSAMAKRLITDSCIHLIEVYGVDGFRFDLAEILGVEVLREIEAALKRVKPGIVLLAEPWSFRGHIVSALRDTGWASWNDGYRDFVRDYVRGKGTSGDLEYYLRGSPWYFAKWPAQTVNYVESHDDRAWIDLITENQNYDGSAPTANDRRRTHLMAAILFMSAGIPMIAAGQDFLRSKHGVNNTYQRGDLNALDYRRLYRYLGTHTYFTDWIDFRLGPYGQLLRQYSRPGDGFYRFFTSADPAALAMICNADGEQGPVRLLFAVNPTTNDVTLPLGSAADAPWRQLADQERFYSASGHSAHRPVESDLVMSALSCGLWVCA